MKIGSTLRSGAEWHSSGHGTAMLVVLKCCYQALCVCVSVVIFPLTAGPIHHPTRASVFGQPVSSADTNHASIIVFKGLASDGGGPLNAL
jgi:hypothetical protein